MPVIAPELVAAIVRDAGGQIIGRTRLQKTAYLLNVAGFDDGFSFAYKHYGPFSEEVANSAVMGSLLGNLNEVVKKTEWGGSYSIYTVHDKPCDDVPAGRLELARKAASADSVVLELTATAVFLSLQGYDNPWEETERRKPEKVHSGRLEKAKALLAKLKAVDVPIPLPNIV